MLVSAVVPLRRQTGLLCRILVNLSWPFSSYLFCELSPRCPTTRSTVTTTITLLPFTITAIAVAPLPCERSHSHDGCAFTPPANEPHLVDTFDNLDLPAFSLHDHLIRLTLVSLYPLLR